MPKLAMIYESQPQLHYNYGTFLQCLQNYSAGVVSVGDIEIYNCLQVKQN